MMAGQSSKYVQNNQGTARWVLAALAIRVYVEILVEIVSSK